VPETADKTTSKPDLTPPVSEADARRDDVGDGSNLDESHPVAVGTDPDETDALAAGQRPPTADSVRVEIQQLEADLEQSRGGYLAYENAKADDHIVRDQNRDAHAAYQRMEARVKHLREKLSQAG